MEEDYSYGYWCISEFCTGDESKDPERVLEEGILLCPDCGMPTLVKTPARGEPPEGE